MTTGTLTESAACFCYGIVQLLGHLLCFTHLLGHLPCCTGQAVAFILLHNCLTLSLSLESRQLFVVPRLRISLVMTIPSSHVPRPVLTDCVHVRAHPKSISVHTSFGVSCVVTFHKAIAWQERKKSIIRVPILLRCCCTAPLWCWHAVPKMLQSVPE